MKKGLFGLALCLICFAAVAQMHPVEKSSSVKFAIKNFGFNVTGSMSGLEGDIVFDPAHPESARFDVTITATTINTGNESRDDHLREEDYFDVKNHPKIRFVSKSVKGSGNSFTLNGELSIKGKTKPVSIPFKTETVGKGFVFDGSFRMNRRDYGIGGGSTISDNLTVTINVTAE